MNLFILSFDPAKAAEQMMDKHVNKILLEAVQMLCTAKRILDPNAPEEVTASLYKLAHKNHPVTIWCRTSRANFVWALDHVDALHTEWKYRQIKEILYSCCVMCSRKYFRLHSILFIHNYIQIKYPNSKKEANKKLLKKRYNTFLVFHSGKVIMSGMEKSYMENTFYNFMKIIDNCYDVIKEKLEI